MGKPMGKLLAALAGASVVWLASCRPAPPPPPPTMAAVVEASGANSSMIDRAAQFRRDIVAASVRTGVVLDARAMAFYVRQPEKLAARCRLLGFADVYLAVSDPARIGEQAATLTALLRELHRAGMQCYAALDLNYLYGYDNSVTLNPFADGLAARAVAPVVGFNTAWGRAADERFDGIEAILLPYRQSAGVSGRSAPLYRWNEDEWGRNSENSTLIRETLDLMRQIRGKAAALTVVQNIGADFHDRTLADQLARGGVNNFLDFCDVVIIDNVSNRPEEILRRITPELRDAVGKASVAVRIITSQDFYGEQAARHSFSRKPWRKLVAELHGVCRKAGAYPSFRGLVFDDFLGLEACWERTR
ncbi:MAG: hypothetical protein PHQ27_06955 [Victivallales bacterium]|nr:hypothetical protein [Victivallales bacterium]